MTIKKNQDGESLIAIGLILAILVVTWRLAVGCAPQTGSVKKSQITIELPKAEEVGKTVGDRTHRFGKGLIDGWQNGNKTEPIEKKEKIMFGSGEQ